MNKKGETPLSKTAYEAWNTKLSACQVYSEKVIPESILEQHREEINRQSPLLHRFYLLRSRIIHRALNYITGHIDENNDFQLLLLGGGLDVSYEKRYPQAKCFVVDVLDIVQARKPHQPFNTVSLEGDLIAWPKVLSDLLMSGLDPTIPTVVIVESVFAYLPSGVPATILHSLATSFRRCFLLIFDVCFASSTENGFAEMLFSKFNTKQAPLLSVYSPGDLHTLLYASAYLHADVLTMYEASCLLLNEKNKAQ
ncbi:hypothetical protein EON65_56115, partial [archaeon]